MSAHTPGKWEYEVKSSDHGGWRQHTQAVSVWCGATLIAAYDTSSCEFPDDAENEANARLIAAAPDLLGVAQYAVDNPDFDSRELDRLARAAISKATGEQA